MIDLNYLEIEKAHQRINDYIRKTPLERSMYLGSEDQTIFFKLESLQKMKNFKVRGAFNKILSLSKEEKELGVATISSGNHGSSVSYAANLIGISKAVVIVPERTPQSKIEKIQHYGAEVIKIGKDYDDAHTKGMQYIKDRKMTYVDSYYSDPQVYAGQGTIAIELLEQNKELDLIVVPIGGGSLITGIAVAAKAIKPDIKIIGVQTEACPAMVRSLKDGVCYEKYPTKPSLCDALVGGVGKLSYQLLPTCVDELLLVSEEGIGKAVSMMAKKEKLIIEAGSATTVAAVMEHGDKWKEKNIALIISGANIDGEVLTELMQQY
ncbi:threonine ammonia-lyase [Tindallia californiensis]|uniref:threonine ammonia-lyase n=1 Tax=Tindallia californiensis TaxID=159292 RepID=A0A1H3KEB3_9FIRM|nr:threonine/serine dehydratase [Tindallia californiensis]SDY50339.1 threonine dehydratase [Tindallia californiensis]